MMSSSPWPDQLMAQRWPTLIAYASRRERILSTSTCTDGVPRATRRTSALRGPGSHTTALTLHELSDAMPAKLDMTVPPGFQRMAAIPEILRLHRARLTTRDVESIDGVRVTTPLRTLIDVIVDGELAPELQAQAVDEALRRGLIRRRQIQDAPVSTRARQRINRVLKQVPDGRSTSIRLSGGATNRPRNTSARAVSSRGR